ncbi:50S ribosomal protein L9 [Pusillimonas noertemannii]|uniref:Large ribosomal subunit protein bL9 n=1 Tax=Pusillimonas noertemannii TaxID=305977 RepID=A0A2U1CHZ3_9BURK|nr:50S ribosomal protein L9 [Pusillimonas noertemannii]NYT69517.1 50S ribosomal protein L9 [Pusillimonas noertemannii]PVY60551.1 LSU ribosomal protein L9P [Pusillimonas noertemannii]TFL09900.1 50S ribosomal protein L9 [Pusillimonas noertemannii]
MQVILLEKVANLGNLGEVVRVRDGYARNYLIPQKIARRATDAALKEFEARRAEIEKAQAEKLAAAEATGAKLNGLTLKLTQKAGVDGRLFGSVTTMDIAAALVAEGFEGVQKSQVRLPDGAIKAVGEFPAQVALHADVVSDITVQVQGEMA